MRPAKTIDIKLNGIYDVSFTLEFDIGKDGNEIGILTVPYIDWMSLPEIPQDVTKIPLSKNVHEISGKLLQCIERYYFDRNAVSIPAEDRPYGLEIEDVIYKVLSDDLYEQLLNGTFVVEG